MTSNEKKIIEHILTNGDKILVREYVNGQWTNVPLTSLPAREALRYAFDWLQNHFIPHIKLETEKAGLTAAKFSVEGGPVELKEDDEKA